MRCFSVCASLVCTVLFIMPVNVLSAEGDTLEGTWTLESRTVNGVSYTQNQVEAYSIHKTGGTWKLNGDGTANCGGTPAKWEYSPVRNLLNVKITNVFGSEVFAISDAYVTFDGDKARLEFKALGIPHIYTLTSVRRAERRISNDASQIEFDETIYEREVYSELVETLPGLPAKHAVLREFSTSITKVELTGREGNVELRLGSTQIATFSAGVREKIERSLGIVVGKRESVSNTYELDGKGFVKVNVRWMERYRKGAIKSADGTKTDFVVCVGLRTIPENVGTSQTSSPTGHQIAKARQTRPSEVSKILVAVKRK